MLVGLCARARAAPERTCAGAGPARCGFSGGRSVLLFVPALGPAFGLGFAYFGAALLILFAG